MESEMAAELRFHLETRAEDLMRAGLPRAEAMRRARIEFGGMDKAKEECRQAKGVGFGESLIQDLRFGLRMLRRSPGFAAIAVLTLALGIGANTAIFSIVNAVMLSSLPIHDPGGLMVVQWLSNEEHDGGISSYGDCERFPTRGSGRKRGCSLSYPMFQEIRSQKEIFSNAAAFAGPARVVLGGAGLLVRTLANLKNIDPGFETKNLLHFSISPTLAGYPEGELPGLYDELQRRLEALPGVTSVSYANDILLDGGLWSTQVHIQGSPENAQVETNMLAVGPDYFATMHIPVVNGRALSASDMRSKLNVVLVNETFVRRYLEGKNPIGIRLQGSSDQNPANREIVGVVADAKYDELRESVAPTTYVPMTGGRVYFEVRSATQPATLIPAVRQLVGVVNQDLPVTDLRTQTETVDRLLNERLVARLATLFGALALILACLGLFGLLSYEVAQRTQEIGIRTALGAPRSQVLGMILRQGLLLAVCGAGAGALAALWATRYLKTLLYGVPATDVATFAAVATLLVGVALLASWVPARRATRVDPMVALRCE
jgi:MacB-like periplasmic core domain/FtsX-like permease family